MVLRKICLFYRALVDVVKFRLRTINVDQQLPLSAAHGQVRALVPGLAWIRTAGVPPILPEKIFSALHRSSRESGCQIFAIELNRRGSHSRHAAQRRE